MAWRGSFRRNAAGGFTRGITGDRNAESRDIPSEIGDFTPVFFFISSARVPDASEAWRLDSATHQWSADSSLLFSRFGDYGYGTGPLASTDPPGSNPGIENWEEDRQSWVSALVRNHAADWAAVGAIRPAYRVFLVQPQYSNLANFQVALIDPGFSSTGFFHVTSPILLGPPIVPTGRPGGVFSYRPPTVRFTGFDRFSESFAPPPSAKAPGVVHDTDESVTHPFYTNLADQTWRRMSGGTLSAGGMQQEFLPNVERPVIRPLYTFRDTVLGVRGISAGVATLSESRLTVMKNRWQQNINPNNSDMIGLQFRGGTFGTGRWLRVLANLIEGRIPR